VSNAGQSNSVPIVAAKVGVHVVGEDILLVPRKSRTT